MKRIWGRIREHKVAAKLARMNKRQKGAAVTAVLLFVAIVGVYNYVPVLKVGSNSSSIYYPDLRKYRTADRMIADVMGTAPMSTKDAFCQLALTGMEREILRSKNITLVKENATTLVESRIATRGLLRNVKRYLGEDYFRLFIEPVVIGDLFGNYYRVNDPQRKIAEGILKDTAGSNLHEAAKKNNIKVDELFIANTQENAAFMAEMRRLGESKKGVYEKLVEDSSGYMIASLKSARDNGVSVEAIVIKKKPFVQFVLDDLKGSNIPASYGLISWYREKDLTGGNVEETNGTKK